MSFLILLIIGSIVIGISKALADITDHSDNWNNSVLSANAETSFFGPKDKTWERKDNNNKVLNWLLHGPLVWTTDIWHLSNSFRIIGYLSSMVAFYYTDVNIFICLILFYSLRSLFFNLFYHLVLRKK